MKENKKKSSCSVLLLIPVVIILGIFWINSIEEDNKTTVTKEPLTETELSVGGVFETGNYIIADGLKIKYNGDYSFTVSNTVG